MRRSYIAGTGSYLPEKVMSNDDWSKLIDTNDEWIKSRTGISLRHIASENQTASDLSLEASKKAIESAGIDKEDLDLILVGTVSGDNPYPSTGNWLQKKLGVSEIPSMDLAAGCSGFLYGLITANGLISSGVVNNVLVVGVEVMSKFMNWEDRNSCVLFGDGAGAVVLRATEEDKGIMGLHWSADGSLGELLIQPAGGSAMPASEETVKNKLHTVHMKGNEVFRHAVTRMAESAKKALEQASVSVEDIDLFIPHQANIRIIDSTIKRAGIPKDKTFVNIDKVANISAATIPVALDQAIEEGRLKTGDTLLTAAFGAGLTWAALVIKF